MKLTMRLVFLLTATAAVMGRSVEEIEEEIQSIQGPWPWRVSLYRTYSSGSNQQESYVCGGSIVNEQWVVTAAHCLRNMNDNNVIKFTVKAGIRYERTFNRYDQTRTVEKYYKHEYYYEDDGWTMNNDIALLKLSQNLSFSGTHVKPIRLPNPGQELEAGKNLMTAAGFIETIDDRYNTLVKTRVRIVSWCCCNETYSSTAVHRTCCVLWKLQTMDGVNCNEDDGGPLVGSECDWSDWQRPICTPYLHGIWSWGADCDHPTMPGVYTKVSNYVSWIMYTIQMDYYDGILSQTTTQCPVTPSTAPQLSTTTTSTDEDTPEEILEEIQRRKGRWPWEVSILRTVSHQGESYHCGGSILNEQWVIIGYEYWMNIDESNVRTWTVKAGFRYQNNYKDWWYEQSVPVEKYYLHFGILLKLSQNLTFNSTNVQPIMLRDPAEQFLSNTNLISSQRFIYTVNISSDAVVKVPVYDWFTCKNNMMIDWDTIACFSTEDELGWNSGQGEALDLGGVGPLVGSTCEWNDIEEWRSSSCTAYLYGLYIESIQDIRIGKLYLEIAGGVVERIKDKMRSEWIYSQSTTPTSIATSPSDGSGQGE